MSSQHRVLLMLFWVLLVLLVQAPEAQSRPSTEETDMDQICGCAPHWVNLLKMKRDPISVNRGLTVKFQCQAAGNPVPTLHWFKNGKSITMSQRRGGFKLKNRTWTLIMESVAQPDSGNYTCVVENKHGRLEHTYQLDVVEDFYSSPVLEAGLLANQTAVVGSDVTFKCKVLNRKGVDVQWLKHFTQNGSIFGPDGRPYFRVLETQTRTSGTDGVEVLTLKNVTLGDEGHYTCLAANDVGFNFQTAWLTVIKPVPSSENTSDFTHAIKWVFDVLFG